MTAGPKILAKEEIVWATPKAAPCKWEGEDVLTSVFNDGFETASPTVRKEMLIKKK